MTAKDHPEKKIWALNIHAKMERLYISPFLSDRVTNVIINVACNGCVAYSRCCNFVLFLSLRNTNSKLVVQIIII